jgi:meso-butanediol dehydrogenase/(S,S)-butanediol dehydrogenase/diacetyl reductase
LEATAGEIASGGGEALAVEVDVTRAESCQRLMEAARQAFGSVDVVVNNAGLVKAGGLATYDEKDWDRLFAVNVKGAFLVSRSAIPMLTEAGGGAIINVSSIAGRRGYPGLAAYCASKFAVIGLTQSMAMELAAAAIRVNAICPGMLPTAMWIDHLSGVVSSAVGKEPGQEAFQAWVRQQIPLGREQNAEDIAQAALYLARAENVTGISLTVAGGFELG